MQANAAFAQKYQFPFPLLSDAKGEVCQAYGACVNLSSDRVSRNTYVIGPEGAILHILEDVTPEDQAEAILAILGEASRLAYQEKSSTNGVPMNSHKGKDGRMNDQSDEAKNGQAHEATKDGPHDAIHKQLQTPDVDRVEQVKPDRGVAASSSMSTSDATQTDDIQSIAPSQVLPSQNSASLVFALGKLGYDFGTEARRDSIMQNMEDGDLLAYLDKNPSQAAAIIWTLSLDATAIYAIQPQGAFASEVYARLRQFLGEQAAEGVDRVSIPGVVFGQVRLMSGQIIPAIWPDLRCMYSWTTAALVEAVVGKAPTKSAEDEEQEAYAQRRQDVTNFLERVYHELRNLGATPQERAINYAATNAFNANKVFESALSAEMELDTIDVERSPICRTDSDCWDVKLLFFDPDNVLRSRRAYRFTVDVSDVCPVTVGDVRSWSVR